MNTRNSMLFRDFRDPRNHLLIGFGCRIVLAFRDLIGFGTKRALRRPVTRQSSGCQWTIRNHPDLLLAAEGQHLPLLFAVEEVQVILHRDEAGPPMLLGDVERLLELPRPHGGGTDIAGLAGPHHVMQRFHRLLDWSLIIPAMDLVEVHVIGPKPLEAVVDLAQDRLAREPSAIRSFMHFAVYLGGDDDLVPIREVLQSASEELLTRANGIDVGSIEEVDPQIEGFLDDRSTVFFVQHPFVNPTLRVPEPHATEAYARHI